MKQPYSAKIKQWLQQQGGPLLRRFTILEHPGKRYFRYWQEGGGCDRNLTEGKAWDAAIESICMNPVRRGLVTRRELWRWSRARFSLDRTRPLDEAFPRLQLLPTSKWE